MLECRKRTFKVLTHALLAFLLLQALINSADAAAKCHKCTGINCQRTTYSAIEDCIDALDSCVSVFEGSTVLAQGCLGQLSSELRNKCEMSTAESADEYEIADNDGEAQPITNRECYQCREDLCNNVSADGFECVQCDSDVDGKCASDTENLTTERCPIGKAVNSYCYAKLAGKHAIRGCAVDLVQQKECLNSNDCVLCTPTDIAGCNREPKVAANDSGSDSGTSGGGSSSGGSGSSDSGTGGGGSNSGGSGGTDSGTGGGGSNSAGSGGSDSGTGGSDSNAGGSGGSDSGTGGGGSSSGGSGGSDSGTGGGGSNSGSSGGSDSGTGGGGSNSGGNGGSDTGNGGSDSNSGSSGGTDSGTGGGGSNSGGSGGSDSGTGSTGGDNSGTDNGSSGANNSTDSGSGNDTSDSGNISGAIDVSSKLSITAILFMLSYFI